MNRFDLGRCRVVGAIVITGLITSLLALPTHAAQTIPGVDIIVKKTPSGKKHTYNNSSIPQGEVVQLDDFEIEIPLGSISTTRSNSKGGLNMAGTLPPTNLGGGNWAVDSFFDITYRIDFEGSGGGGGGGGGGGITPFDGSGMAHIVGPGVTNFDRDADGDVDADDDILNALEGPIHQFDVDLDAMNLVDPNSFWMLRESPTRQSTGQILRRDLPNGQFVIASFFDVFFELSLDGGQTWSPATSSARFMTVPEPTTLLLTPALAGLALLRRGKRGTA